MVCLLVGLLAFLTLCWLSALAAWLAGYLAAQASWSDMFPMVCLIRAGNADIDAIM
jgi:cytochrome c biogenesis protein CcdA